MTLPDNTKELVLVDKGGHTELRTARELKSKPKGDSLTLVLVSFDALNQLREQS